MNRRNFNSYLPEEIGRRNQRTDDNYDASNFAYQFDPAPDYDDKKENYDEEIANDFTSNQQNSHNSPSQLATGPDYEENEDDFYIPNEDDFYIPEQEKVFHSSRIPQSFENLYESQKNRNLNVNSRPDYEENENDDDINPERVRNVYRPKQERGFDSSRLPQSFENLYDSQYSKNLTSPSQLTQKQDYDENEDITVEEMRNINKENKLHVSGSPRLSKKSVELRVRSVSQMSRNSNPHTQLAPDERVSRKLAEMTETGSITMRDIFNVARALGLMQKDVEPAVDTLQVENFKKICWGRNCTSETCFHSQRRGSVEDTDKNQRQQLEMRYGSILSKRSPRMQSKTLFSRFKSRLYEIFNRVKIWHHSIRHVEGHFGTSIASYFIFIRLLLFLNFGISAIIIGFIVLPQALDQNFEETTNYTQILSSDDVEICSTHYQNVLKQNNIIKKFQDNVTDFLQGTGWLESTLMFIGSYDIKVQKFQFISYNIPLAYLLTTIAFLFLSLLFMLKSAAKGFKENAITSEGHLYNYCNTVFTGWDCCINKIEAAKLKHEMITTELLSCLEEEKLKKQKEDRTRKERFLLYLIRFVINILIFFMLGGALWCIKLVSDYSNDPKETHDANLAFLIEYLPPLTITGFNIVLPLIFYFLVTYEKYSPAFVINVNLARTVFLRLVAIFMLLYTFKIVIEKDDSKRCTSECVKNNNCNIKLCWETYIGQQIYKLFLLDFVTALISTFGVGFLRMIAVTKINWKPIQMIGQEEFDIPKHVLDLVYFQTLCWLGAFFCPFLPVASFAKCILFFYIKKFHLTVNCIPSRKPYRASKSNSFFMSVLLLSFGFLVLVPLTYSIAAIPPSRGCSPFRTKYETMWQIISDPISQWDSPYFDLVRFISTAGFAVPIIIMLFLFIYYNYTVAATYKKMSSVLKEHLLMEGRDKRFLLDRLTQVTQKLWQNNSLNTPDMNLRKRSPEN